MPDPGLHDGSTLLGGEGQAETLDVTHSIDQNLVGSLPVQCRRLGAGCLTRQHSADPAAAGPRGRSRRMAAGEHGHEGQASGASTLLRNCSPEGFIEF